MSTNERTCGDCSACCHTHSVNMDGVQTPLFKDCTHMCTGGGCAIYEQRPTSCREYECLWRSTTSWHDAMRPDRWGIVVDMWPVPEETLIYLNLWEVIPGRLNEPYMQAFIQGMMKSDKYVVLLHRADLKPDMRFPEGTDDAEKMRLTQVVLDALYAAGVYEKGV